MIQHNFRLSLVQVNLAKYLLFVIFEIKDQVGFVELLLTIIILTFLAFRYYLQNYMLLLFILKPYAKTLFYLIFEDLKASDAFFKQI